jgi:hypothetical protein
MGRVVFFLLILLSFVPPVWMGAYCFQEGWDRPFVWEGLQSGMRAYVATAGSGVACLALLGVAVRASSSITGERDRQTLDSLLTSPLRVGEILFGKWLGSVVAVRWLWVWIGAIWACGVLTGAMYVPALALMVAAWAVYAALIGVLGLWFSAGSRTTLRANMGALTATVMVGGGHWLLWLTCCAPVAISIGYDSGTHQFVEPVRDFELYALTPPSAFVWPVLSTEYRNDAETDKAVALTLVGLVLWVVATVVWWRATCRRFAAQTARLSRRPRQPPVEPQARAPAPA